MKKLYKSLNHGIAWNTLESVSYQSALIAHQVALFKIVGHAAYGLIGTAFSVLYFIVMCTNAGFNEALSGIFTHATRNKLTFKKLVIPHLIGQLALLISASCALLALSLYTNTFSVLTPTVTMLIAGLIICEGLKKHLRILLQLAFANKKTASIELATIITYIASVWGWYLWHGSLSVISVLAPMFATSALSASALVFFALRWYKNLPDSAIESSYSTDHTAIFTNRFFNFINGLQRQLFSGNFLVPFVALQFGPSHAGILKLVSHAAHGVSSIMHTVFGISSAALFARLKHASTIEKRHAFTLISSRVHHVLLGLAVFCTINHQFLQSISGTTYTATHWYAALLVLFMHGAEQFFIVYEALYIAHEQSHILCAFNVASSGLLYCVLTTVGSFSLASLLVALIAVRTLSYAAMCALTLYRWNIAPTFSVRKTYIAYSLVFSLAFFLIAPILL